MDKKSTMRVIDIVDNILGADKMIENFINVGLNRMDSHFLDQAIHAHMLLVKYPQMPESKRQRLQQIADPWLPIERWLQENEQWHDRIVQLARGFWNTLEDAISSTENIKKILMQKPDNARLMKKYGEYADSYIRYAAARLYDKFYDYVWGDEDEREEGTQ